MNMEKWKEEVRKAEADFAAAAAEKGIAAAFAEFAAEDAVLHRENRLLRGRQEIADYYGAQGLEGADLKWSPEHVDVAVSGEMAYTFGPYRMEIPKPQGGSDIYEGTFHTVWKRGADGRWRYVWD